MANGRCKYHGGKALWGPANGNWKHGKYSKYLPQQLRRRVAYMLKDPDYLSLRSEIALIHARISELVESLSQGSTPEVWRDIRVCAEQLRRLIETETRLLEEREMTLTIDRVHALMGALVEVVCTHVPERERRQRILSDVDALLEH